jgi:hypothetical protein
VGAPLFEKAEVKIGDKTLTVIAEKLCARQLYVQKVFLNDAPLDRTWFVHDEIAHGVCEISDGAVALAPTRMMRAAHGSLRSGPMSIGPGRRLCVSITSETKPGFPEPSFGGIPNDIRNSSMRGPTFSRTLVPAFHIVVIQTGRPHQGNPLFLVKQNLLLVCPLLGQIAER